MRRAEGPQRRRVAVPLGGRPLLLLGVALAGTTGLSMLWADRALARFPLREGTAAGTAGGGGGAGADRVTGTAGAVGGDGSGVDAGDAAGVGAIVHGGGGGGPSGVAAAVAGGGAAAGGTRGEGEARPTPEEASLPCDSAGSGAARAASAPAEALTSTPRVGISVAVHPPKFHHLARFLEEFTACPAAVGVLRVYVVFSTVEDRALFEDCMRCLSPSVSPVGWEGVVAIEPESKWSGRGDQFVAAYKKWFGIAHMMDLGERAPDYGVMCDAELLLFAREEPARRAACQPGGAWSTLLERIRASEATRSFPAARVGTAVNYSFGGRLHSGQMYDRLLIKENARFVNSDWKGCSFEGCAEVRRQIDEVLFSWWTDLPWLRLTVAARLLELVARTEDDGSGWRSRVVFIRFPRFEHLSYQQFCVLHEGFSFRDVTNLTGEAKWGSYMEDPQQGARLGELRPLWVSGQAVERLASGLLAPPPPDAPPLLVFHADQGSPLYPRDEHRERWEAQLERLRSPAAAEAA